MDDIRRGVGQSAPRPAQEDEEPEEGFEDEEEADELIEDADDDG